MQSTKQLLTPVPLMPLFLRPPPISILSKWLSVKYDPSRYYQPNVDCLNPNTYHSHKSIKVHRSLNLKAEPFFPKAVHLNKFSWLPSQKELNTNAFGTKSNRHNLSSNISSSII